MNNFGMMNIFCMGLGLTIFFLALAVSFYNIVPDEGYHLQHFEDGKLYGFKPLQGYTIDGEPLEVLVIIPEKKKEDS